MVKLYTTCKFCDERVYFEVPKDSDAYFVTYAFKAAMEAHLDLHVEEMVSVAHA